MKAGALAGVRDRAVAVMKRVISDNPKVRSRSAFADAIKTTPAAVNRWENKAGSPTIENLVDICTKFGASPDYLLKGIPPMFSGKGSEMDELRQRVEKIERKVFRK